MSKQYYTESRYSTVQGVKTVLYGVSLQYCTESRYSTVLNNSTVLYQEISEEVSNMCDLSAGVWERGLEQGITQGYSKGVVQGTNNVLSLFSNLYAQGRSADVERATKDREYLNKLFTEFKL